jgi:hypothetical protein
MRVIKLVSIRFFDHDANGTARATISSRWLERDLSEKPVSTFRLTL